ncbi:hypothetical protein SO802_004512 [Lithocarpus litseifolius]|uniref:C2HC zinc finger plants domain-containing protein n=1 Tax=Lithocarpus litseifolius TaxID=425828 RepID=A0AAW2E6R4_9ROSI
MFLIKDNILEFVKIYHVRGYASLIFHLDHLGPVASKGLKCSACVSGGTVILSPLFGVVMAMRTKGGDEAVFHSLHRARELYRNRLQENAAADQLACLFAECAIVEAQPLKIEPSVTITNVGGPSIAPDAHGTSILAESGRMQVVLDAFSDGSSFICLQCGGLVSNHRKDEHYAYWCCQT